MYAIHIVERAENASASENLFGFGELSDVLPQVSACRVEHVFASPSPKPAAAPGNFGRSGVVFVSAPSADAAGVAVLAAVHRLITRLNGQFVAELRQPEKGEGAGLCHGVVSVGGHLAPLQLGARSRPLN
ncbi:hypothetical protein OG762_15550 [Streptomyces sp. NBC_01136]|uniref:hypothetical protein n=1 Tax=unclassified Streptomyces TaxID=2593676 RepID=UPI003253B8A3|nr:hypothetical protein OG762_15550 [Streptomyces sp. NBC_01136]